MNYTNLPRFRFLLLAATVLLATVSAFAGDDPPQWLRASASQAVPAYDKDVPAVYLFSEQQVSLGSDGKLVTTENQAIKLLDRSARTFAVARVFYLVSSGKVRDIQAWLIRPDGTVKAYDKKTIVDVIACSVIRSHLKSSRFFIRTHGAFSGGFRLSFRDTRSTCLRAGRRRA
jgi:hypothetical protein